MQLLNSHCGVDRDPRGVVRLTICNAGSLNILGSAVINDAREGLEVLGADRQIRVLVIAGQSEKSMIGGADIKEMAKLDQASAEKFITGLRDLCEAVRAFPAPVIARMPGWCLGGGLEVAAACDFRVAAHDAKFGMPEVKVGIPSVIHAALLPRLIGWGRARWLVMTTVRYTWSKPNAQFLPRMAEASPLFIYRPAHYLKPFHKKYSERVRREAAEGTAKRRWSAVHNRMDNLYEGDNPELPTLQPWHNTTRPPADRFVGVRNPYFHRVDEIVKIGAQAAERAIEMINEATEALAG